MCTLDNSTSCFLWRLNICLCFWIQTAYKVLCCTVCIYQVVKMPHPINNTRHLWMKEHCPAALYRQWKEKLNLTQVIFLLSTALSTHHMSKALFVALCGVLQYLTDDKADDLVHRCIYSGLNCRTVQNRINKSMSSFCIYFTASGNSPTLTP